MGSRSSSRLRFPSVLRISIGWGVDALDGDEVEVKCCRESACDVIVSILTSSLIVEFVRCGKGGGGVLMRSSQFSQNSGPPELRIACRPKLADSRGCFMILFNSSIASLTVVDVTLGDGGAVIAGESTETSDSRTCRMTAASCLLSLSIGQLSSWSAARILANPFGLG